MRILLCQKLTQQWEIPIYKVKHRILIVQISNKLLQMPTVDKYALVNQMLSYNPIIIESVCF